MKEIAPAPMMFNANIVLGNQLGKGASGKNTSPAIPVRRNDQHEGDEPADGAPHLEEDESAERSQDRPQRHPAGREEPAHEHLPGRRGEEDVDELGDEEKPEVAGSREDHQGAERDGEIDERGDACPRTEAEVEAAPHDGHRQDQRHDKGEERLLLTQVLVVPGIRADPGEPCHRVADPRIAGSGHGRIFTVSHPDDKRLAGRADRLIARDLSTGTGTEAEMSGEGHDPAGTGSESDLHEVKGRLVGVVKAREVSLTGSAAGLVAANGDLSILNGGCGPVLTGGSLTIRNGGCGPVIARGDASIENGGTQAILAAGGATIGRHAFVGIVASPKVTIEEGGRVLLDRPLAIAVGAGIGLGVVLLSRLMRR